MHIVCRIFYDCGFFSIGPILRYLLVGEIFTTFQQMLHIVKSFRQCCCEEVLHQQVSCIISKMSTGPYLLMLYLNEKSSRLSWAIWRFSVLQIAPKWPFKVPILWSCWIGFIVGQKLTVFWRFLAPKSHYARLGSWTECNGYAMGYLLLFGGDSRFVLVQS